MASRLVPLLIAPCTAAAFGCGAGDGRDAGAVAVQTNDSGEDNPSFAAAVRKRQATICAVGDSAGDRTAASTPLWRWSGGSHANNPHMDPYWRAGLAFADARHCVALRIELSRGHADVAFLTTAPGSWIAHGSPAGHKYPV